MPTDEITTIRAERVAAQIEAALRYRTGKRQRHHLEAALRLLQQDYDRGWADGYNAAVVQSLQLRQPPEPSAHEWEPPFSAASDLCGAMVMRDGGGDECGIPREHPVHREAKP